MRFNATYNYAILPDLEVEYEGDVGIDLPIPETNAIPAHGARRINHCFSVELPNSSCGLVAMLSIVPRSSTLFRHGLIVVPGAVDSNYTGDLKTQVYNPTDEDVFLGRGEKISQGIIHWVQALPSKGDERESKGFGSTG